MPTNNDIKQSKGYRKELARKDMNLSCDNLQRELDALLVVFKILSYET